MDVSFSLHTDFYLVMSAYDQWILWLIITQNHYFCWKCFQDIFSNSSGYFEKLSVYLSFYKIFFVFDVCYNNVFRCVFDKLPHFIVYLSVMWYINFVWTKNLIKCWTYFDFIFRELTVLCLFVGEAWGWNFCLN